MQKHDLGRCAPSQEDGISIGSGWVRHRKHHGWPERHVYFDAYLFHGQAMAERKGPSGVIYLRTNAAYSRYIGFFHFANDVSGSAGLSVRLIKERVFKERVFACRVE